MNVIIKCLCLAVIIVNITCEKLPFLHKVPYDIPSNQPVIKNNKLLQKDNSTIALYKFEGRCNEIINEVKKKHGISFGATRCLGKIGRALCFSDSEYVQLGMIIPDGLQSGTIEISFFFSDEADLDQGLYSIVGNRGCRAQLFYNKGELLFFKNHSDIFKYISYKKAFQKNVWYSVLVSWGQKGMRMYLDDDLVASNTDVSNYQEYITGFFDKSFYEITLGKKEWCCLEEIGISNRSNTYWFRGGIDELRISNIQRL